MIVTAQPLTHESFHKFGDVIDTTGDPDMVINQGLCDRFHDRARLDFGNGRAGISLFRAEPRALPYEVEMMERHPLGSQAFIPMSLTSFLVVVAPDNADTPGEPLAFRTEPGQAINFLRGTWHGVLTPLSEPGLFAVIDRIGEGQNLQEHWLDVPVTVM